MALPLGDVDVVPLRTALAGHAHAVWVAVLRASATGHPLPVEVLHNHWTFRRDSLAQRRTFPASTQRAIASTQAMQVQI